MVDAMWLAITEIEAQQAINQMFLADWPNMKKEARKKKHKELFDLAYPRAEKKKNFVTLDEVQRLLGR
jgi:hypothetical protein